MFVLVGRADRWVLQASICSTGSRMFQRGFGLPPSLLSSTPLTPVNVRLYGETEFWFALIKVLAIIGMIGFGLWLLFSGHGGEKASIDNLWRYGGFFATGWNGLILSLAVIMFSFGGLELIGITAAEARDPEKSIPKAVNQVVYRILLFYIGSLVVLLALYPWVEVKSNSSPFVMIFHNLDSNVVASALNFVILVASLSVYNSGVYSNSRMLFGLSVQGNAPKFLTRVSRRGVPINSLMLSGAITSLVVLINYLLPQKAFGLLMALCSDVELVFVTTVWIDLLWQSLRWWRCDVRAAAKHSLLGRW